ncbi:MAG: T9SS type A sorting domain-containing protein [Bacteroidales bacterium]|nr:T9SS type A sorting domain-containing protein [Bacteroidales bacterium]
MKRYLINRKIFLLIFALFGSSFSMFSQVVVNVSSIPQMQAAINVASTGDIIVLADGTYLNANVVIRANGITVRPETIGGAFLNGQQSIEISGNNNTFKGFQFTAGDNGDGSIIDVSGDKNILTQLNFNGYSSKKYIVIKAGSQFNEISYCNIENKPVTAVTGCTIQISTSPSVPGYHKISHCSFKNFPGPGGDYGNEPIRIGLSTERDNNSRTIVEHCYFTNVGLGDSESISIKSCENICRYNTFSNNPEGLLVFRNGDRNIAYSNFFINNSGGIRLKEARDSYCYNNYFETGSADALIFMYEAATPLDKVNVVHNTFVNMGKIDLGGSNVSNVTFANNIFKKSSGGIFRYPSNTETWIGNIYSGSLGIIINSGMTNVDPLLEINSDNYFSLSSGSPAIDASISGYPSIIDILNIDDDPYLIFDINGQSRPEADALKDVGCDEFSSDSITIHPLTLSDVGPSFLGGPPLPVLSEQSISFPALPSKVYGDQDFSPGATASSGLSVAYASSDNAVATIVDGNIHITGGGIVTITASQTGDSIYDMAANVSQTLIVNKLDQFITFDAIPDKVFGVPDFSAGAVASSGLEIAYTSSDTIVASIIDSNIHLVGEGTTTITASQTGNTAYNAANDVSHTFTVTLALSDQKIEPEKNRLIVYPNPAAENIRVKYSLRSKSTVQLKIYNLKGQVEKVLISNENQMAGEYALSFDLNNLESGFYFIRLTTTNGIQTNKLIIKNGYE